MENKKERVLAYNMAKVITDDALIEVSGGKGYCQCSRKTIGGSAGSGQPTEVHFEMVWDFDL